MKDQSEETPTTRHLNKFVIAITVILAVLIIGVVVYLALFPNIQWGISSNIIQNL